MLEAGGPSNGGSSSSSTNSSVSLNNNNMDTSIMSSISSNSPSNSPSACLTEQHRAANINQSFQKHFQNLSALERPPNFERISDTSNSNVFDVTSSYSSSNSLTSLDRRLCKTLPRKFKKGSVGSNQIIHNGSKLDARSFTGNAVLDAANTINHQSSVTKCANSTKSRDLDKRNSDPYLDVSTSVAFEMAESRIKSSKTASQAPQRHSFGGLIVNRVVPPPAKYKAVHFAPNVEVSKSDNTPSPEDGEKISEIAIPTEGLPTRPARAPPKMSVSRTAVTANKGSSIIIPKTSETVPIVVKNLSDRPPSDIIQSAATNVSGVLSLSDNFSITRRSSSLTFNGGDPSNANYS